MQQELLAIWGEGAEELSVTFYDEKSYDATVVGVSEKKDIAVIKVALNDIKPSTIESIAIATIGDSNKLKVGNGIIAIRNALGYGQSVTTGVVSALNREVEKCPASVNFKNYKKILQEGRNRFEQLEAQANEIIKNYNKALNKFSKLKGESEIVKKRNVSSINLENTTTLIADANSLVGELSEENRRVEELVRKSEEIVRKSADLSNKLTEAKSRSGVIKAQIEKKKEEIAPKIAEIEKQIKELEPKVQDKEKYDKYLEMKEKGIFPVFVNLEDVFCGGCKVELSLNFIEKLKTKKMLSCEHCGRIIMFK